jgi:hypothetical protein
MKVLYLAGLGLGKETSGLKALRRLLCKLLIIFVFSNIDPRLHHATISVIIDVHLLSFLSVPDIVQFLLSKDGTFIQLEYKKIVITV